jgi:glyoxylase-like metal-dependent hydrolase (beta-lactamase superfamily II)
VTLTRTFQVGDLTCHTLEGGRQWLDGGAMFGIVPRVLWERVIDVDDKNRIPLAMRCLAIEHPEGLVLVDTGVGNKEDDKFRGIYGIANDGDPGPTQLEDGLATLGYAPEDVRFVLNTHLHFDHAGGNTFRDGTGRVAPTFPNARYVVQRGELEFAMNTNERTAGSYLPPNFVPVTEAHRWELLDDHREVLPGIRTLATPGHVPHHQSILVESGDQIACFLGDLVPTTRHLRIPWIMGYDLEPVVTMEFKQKILPQAADEGWVLIFEHDPDHLGGTVRPDGRKFVIDRSL